MRRRRPERRQIHPDPVYKDLLVAKFVNNLMMDGKKSIAEKIFYGALENIAGIYNSKKNILGMMPHPERMVDKLISNTDGLNLFSSLMN